MATSKVAEVNKAIFKQAELLKQGVAIENSDPQYEYASFQQMKPEMMAEAIKNAQNTTEQFAEASHVFTMTPGAADDASQAPPQYQCFLKIPLRTTS